MSGFFGVLNQIQQYVLSKNISLATKNITNIIGSQLKTLLVSSLVHPTIALTLLPSISLTPLVIWPVDVLARDTMPLAAGQKYN